MNNIFLVTTSMCPACPAAKDYVKEIGIEDDVTIMTADQEPLAMEFAKTHGIRSVPTFVMKVGEEYKTFSLQQFKELKK